MIRALVFRVARNAGRAAHVSGQRRRGRLIACGPVMAQLAMATTIETSRSLLGVQ